MSELDSSIERLLEGVRSALHARRRGLADSSAQLHDLVAEYEHAVEYEIAARFAHEHGLKHPVRAGPSPIEAAQALKAAVLALPELAGESGSTRPAAPSRPTWHPPEPAPAAAPSSKLRELLASRKLVILGALSGRDRASTLPADLAANADVIDTERDGVHAIGNLPQRIRQGRVAAVVILDRVVQHKHTEPVIAAARDVNVPVAFAGQGGKASLLRALEQIEEMLSKG